MSENLAKIRKDKGLTQEALAIKLNIVRQTISKWENGTAVPDANMLCKIAEALDVSVAKLLGSSECDDKIDTFSITKSLEEINEQLIIKNKRNNIILKICLGIGTFFLIGIVIAINTLPNTHDNRNNSTALDNGTTELEIDESKIPLLNQINKSNENAILEYFGCHCITKKQLIQSWGNIEKETENSTSWLINEDEVITVFFNNEHYAYNCGIESR